MPASTIFISFAILAALYLDLAYIIIFVMMIIAGFVFSRCCIKQALNILIIIFILVSCFSLLLLFILV